jgi:hypothetical protein
LNGRFLILIPSGWLFIYKYYKHCNNFNLAKGALAAIITAKLPGKKKPRLLAWVFELRAWQFPTFAWQTATLSSALSGFTSEFGMGSGGSRSLWSPSKLVSSQALSLLTVFGVFCTPLEICNVE